MDGQADCDWKSVGLSDVTAADLIEVSAISRTPQGTLPHAPHRSQLGVTSCVYGREKETALLKETWDRVSSDPGASSELVWLLGASGAGKSFLTEALRKHVFQTNNGIFVSSKFDQLTFARREPFYVIVAALSDICEIVAGDSKLRGSIATEARNVLGDDLVFSSRLIPTLKQLLGSDGDWDNFSSSETDDGTAVSLMKTKRTCKAFLACVSKHRPVFLVLDDIQWSDSRDTQDLIEALISDVDSKNVCYVLAAREGHQGTENTNPANAFLSQRISNGDGDTHKLLPFVTIKIENLNVTEVDQMIRGFLDCPDSVVTTTLTRIVFEKTAGNPFFITQFLRLLYLKNLLTYSEEDGFWRWETEDKIALLDVSRDVARSIDARVNCLNAMTRSGLQVAAHLGFRFRIDVFEMVMSSIYRRAYSNEDEPTRRQRFSRVLKSAEKESMIICAADGNEMCFMHDRVQQCLYELVPEGETKARMCLTIGRTLRSKAITEPHLTFLAADLCNEGQGLIEDGEEKDWLVQLNLVAAKLSVDTAAFSNSSHYLKNAIGLVDETSVWSDDYDRALGLWSSLAWSSCNANDFEECQSAFDVVESKSRNPLDKHSAYQALMLSCIVQGKMDETISIGLAALEELGVNISRRPSLVSLLYRTFRVRSRLLKLSKSDFISLPKLDEGSKEAVVLDILGRMHFPMVMTEDKFLVHQAHLLIVQYSLSHGLSPQTPFGIANFGVLECALKNFKEGRRLGMLSQDMTRQLGVEDEMAGNLAIALQGVVLPWSSPWIDMVEPLCRAAKIGREHGDFLGSPMCFGMACSLGFLTQPSLSLVTEMCSLAVQFQLKLHHKSVHVKLPKMVWQQSLNLMGRGDCHLKLDGEVMTESELVEDDVLTSFLTDFYKRKLELACYFRSVVQAQKYAERLEEADLGGLRFVCPVFVSMNFFCALTYVDKARTRCQARKNLNKARRTLKWLTSIHRKGCVDAEPFLLILSAELSAMGSIEVEKLRSKFDEAIDVALKHGFHGIASLACERAYFVLREHLSYEETRSYWRRTIDLYTAWGAFGKVDALKVSVEARGMIDTTSTQPPVVVDFNVSKGD